MEGGQSLLRAREEARLADNPTLEPGAHFLVQNWRSSALLGPDIFAV